MPGCSAGYCTNSSAKKFQMCRFPTDPVRQRIWIQNVHRDDLQLDRNSYLCENHFTSDMWETYYDGRRRLKSTAIPTIFENSSNEIIIQECLITDNVELTHAIWNQATAVLHPESQKVTEDAHTENLLEKDEQLENPIQTPCQKENDRCVCLNRHQLDERLEKYEKLFQRSERLRRSMALKMKRMRSKIKRLEHELRVNRDQTGLNKIFNDDQISLLNNQYKKVPRWCDATMTKALKLKFTCGTSGYNELLKQHFPLPSLRTVFMKSENLKTGSGISNEIHSQR